MTSEFFLITGVVSSVFAIVFILVAIIFYIIQLLINKSSIIDYEISITSSMIMTRSGKILLRFQFLSLFLFLCPCISYLFFKTNLFYSSSHKYVCTFGWCLEYFGYEFGKIVLFSLQTYRIYTSFDNTVYSVSVKYIKHIFFICIPVLLFIYFIVGIVCLAIPSQLGYVYIRERDADYCAYTHIPSELLIFSLFVAFIREISFSSWILYSLVSRLHSMNAYARENPAIEMKKASDEKGECLPIQIGVEMKAQDAKVQTMEKSAEVKTIEIVTEVQTILQTLEIKTEIQALESTEVQISETLATEKNIQKQKRRKRKKYRNTPIPSSRKKNNSIKKKKNKDSVKSKQKNHPSKYKNRDLKRTKSTPKRVRKLSVSKSGSKKDRNRSKSTKISKTKNSKKINAKEKQKKNKVSIMVKVATATPTLEPTSDPQLEPPIPHFLPIMNPMIAVNTESKIRASSIEAVHALRYNMQSRRALIMKYTLLCFIISISSFISLVLLCMSYKWTTFSISMDIMISSVCSTLLLWLSSKWWRFLVYVLYVPCCCKLLCPMIDKHIETQVMSENEGVDAFSSNENSELINNVSDLNIKIAGKDGDIQFGSTPMPTFTEDNLYVSAVGDVLTHTRQSFSSSDRCFSETDTDSVIAGDGGGIVRAISEFDERADGMVEFPYIAENENKEDDDIKEFGGQGKLSFTTDDLST